MSVLKGTDSPRDATRNACKLCTPFGACMVFKGIKKCVPFLHGSQGCATYIRRYMISHFREPVDIASSSFSEDTAIFGGEKNFMNGVENVIRQYQPDLVGIASTCLSETIGDDVTRMVREFRQSHKEAPALVNVSTASYRGTHAEGFQSTLLALVSTLAEKGPQHDGVNLIAGMMSPADLRHLKELFNLFELKCTLLPDYSETLDAGAWDEYKVLPEGGTGVEEIRRMGSARATIHLASTVGRKNMAGFYLRENFGVPCSRTSMPIGLRLTDAFIDELSWLSDKKVPASLLAERGRLVDAYVDAHKYLFGKRAVVFGEEDIIVPLIAFLSETGIKPVLAVSGGQSGRLKKALDIAAPEVNNSGIEILDGSDFEDMAEKIRESKPDLLVGNSKGYTMARELEVPLVRVGFPIHDRFGGQRILSVGYKGTQELFDKLVNAVIEQKQKDNPWGYTYM